MSDHPTINPRMPARWPCKRASWRGPGHEGEQLWCSHPTCAPDDDLRDGRNCTEVRSGGHLTVIHAQDEYCGYVERTDEQILCGLHTYRK